MADLNLSTEEAALLRSVLAPLVIKSRTGEVGILHGMGRFVSTQVILKKRELDTLDEVARKLGLGSGIGRTSQ